jgi:putative membrane protein
MEPGVSPWLRAATIRCADVRMRTQDRAGILTPVSQQQDFRCPALLLALYAPIWLLLAIAPVSRSDWLLENLLVLAAVPMLIATARRLRFSNATYTCLFVFFVLHSIGAHYTYALVPYDRWWTGLTGHSLNEIFGWQRNHYDRLVHLLYGVLMLPAAVELFGHYAPPRGVWRWLMPVFFVMSHSAIYETVEWLAAVIVAPDLGTAYLGTQGDEWDAQQDMALAAAGATLSMLFLRLRFARSHRAH